jgi:colanic acid biosynthesis glycosyl transferase WcaI
MPSKLTGMLSSGRAILATAHPGTQLAVELEGRGVVTPPGDVAAFVSALIQLADDGEQRRRLGEEARMYAVHYLDREEILCQFELDLLDVCGQALPQTGESTSAAEATGFRRFEDLEIPLVTEKSRSSKF